MRPNGQYETLLKYSRKIELLFKLEPVRYPEDYYDRYSADTAYEILYNQRKNYPEQPLFVVRLLEKFKSFQIDQIEFLIKTQKLQVLFQEYRTLDLNELSTNRKKEMKKEIDSFSHLNSSLDKIMVKTSTIYTKISKIFNDINIFYDKLKQNIRSTFDFNIYGLQFYLIADSNIWIHYSRELQSMLNNYKFLSIVVPIAVNKELDKHKKEIRNAQLANVFISKTLTYERSLKRGEKTIIVQDDEVETVRYYQKPDEQIVDCANYFTKTVRDGLDQVALLTADSNCFNCAVGKPISSFFIGNDNNFTNIKEKIEKYIKSLEQ